MPYPLPLTRTEAYLAYKAGVIQQSDLKPSLAVPRNGIDAWLAYWTGLAADYPKREDGTPHILQEEEAYIAYLCGVIDTYPEKCLRRVGAYLRYLISARWGRPDHPLNREELYLSLIKTQFIPSGDPSSDITIDGTAKAAFVDIKMYGDTFQQTYTGKNLYYDTDGYAQGFIGDNGDISYSTGSVSNKTYIKASGDTQYVVSFNAIVGGVELRGVGCYDSNKDFIARIPVTGITDGSFQTAAGTAYIRVYFYNANGLNATNFPTNYISDIQLELGSTATSFEPFVGGQPSPNPDYPQAIQAVTGEQTVTVVGKNLFNPNSVTIGKVIDGDGSLSISNGGSTSDYIPVKPSTTYHKTTTGSARFKFYGISKNPLSSVYGDIPTASDEQSFTTPADCYFIRFSFRDTLIDSIQIEIGSSATAYTPYRETNYPISLGSIKLCNLDDTYVDYIWEDGDEWKLHKEVWEYTFTDVNGFIWGTDRNRLYIGPTVLAELGINFVPPASQTSEFYALSEKFKVEAFDTGYAASYTGACFICSSGRTWSFRGGWSNETAARTALVGTTVNYALATPTDTVITNQALIDQLEALVNGGAENGTTYIKVSATDPNLPGLLVVEAPKYE